MCSVYDHKNEERETKLCQRAQSELNCVSLYILEAILTDVFWMMYFVVVVTWAIEKGKENE